MGAAERVTTNVRSLRLAAGMTQAALAEAVGCEPQYIATIEQQPRNVSLRLLASVAAAVGVDIAVLLAPAHPPEPRPIGRPPRAAVVPRPAADAKDATVAKRRG